MSRRTPVDDDDLPRPKQIYRHTPVFRPQKLTCPQTVSAQHDDDDDLPRPRKNYRHFDNLRHHLEAKWERERLEQDATSLEQEAARVQLGHLVQLGVSKELDRVEQEAARVRREQEEARVRVEQEEARVRLEMEDFLRPFREKQAARKERKAVRVRAAQAKQKAEREMRELKEKGRAMQSNGNLDGAIKKYEEVLGTGLCTPEEKVECWK